MGGALIVLTLIELVVFYTKSLISYILLRHNILRIFNTSTVYIFDGAMGVFNSLDVPFFYS